MARKTISKKNQEKIPSLGEWRAPWETESGGDAEIDKAKLRTFIYNLKVGEAEALDALEDAKVFLAEADEAVAEAKKQAADASPEEAQRRIAKLEKDNADLKAENERMTKEKAEADLRAEVLAGVDPKVAKYVKGETKEELEASLADVKADFGIVDERDDEEEDEDDDDVLNSRPRSRLRNLGDPDSGKPGEQEIDFDAVADNILGTSVFR